MNGADKAGMDADVGARTLDPTEQAGLQIYRNYVRSFEDHALSLFRQALDREALDLGDFQRVLKLVASEDARFLPMIACAYTDDVLKGVFRDILPADIPGGVTDMLGGYGPLSDLSKRIRLAFAFDVLSKDLLKDIDLLRSVRNRIAHDWDISALRDFYIRGRVSELTPVEKFWAAGADVSSEIKNVQEPSAIFRIRAVWILGRLTYEANGYNRAKTARLLPERALYEHPTRWLADIATICMDQTRVIARAANS